MLESRVCFLAQRGFTRCFFTGEERKLIEISVSFKNDNLYFFKEENNLVLSFNELAQDEEHVKDEVKQRLFLEFLKLLPGNLKNAFKHGWSY